jgi:hypothetical protein
MSYVLPEDWYIEESGESLILDQEKVAAEIDKLRVGLDAAIRAAKLAIFVIRKQGVMPNSSWQAGFEQDLAIATEAREALDNSKNLRLPK